LQLDQVPVKKSVVKSCPIVIIADTTFIKRTFGICVIRSPRLKKNLIWRVSKTETALTYHQLRWQLEKQGFKIQAAVIDGKPGLIKAFHDLPTQMCHFHQMAIMTRYLTTRPKLPAGQVLRQIALLIPESNEEEMKDVLDIWHNEWKDFLNEKTYNPFTGQSFYTHKRLRSAYRSITKHLSLLYTYQKYSKLKIPNTTNSLDGTFSHLKDMLRIHRGLNRSKKIKMIDEILSK
jgi:hypothetical protein